MDLLRRSAMSLRSSRCIGFLECQYGLSSFLERKPIKRVSDVGLASFSSSMATRKTAIGNSTKRLLVAFKSDYGRQPTADANHWSMEIFCPNGNTVLCGGHLGKECMVGLGSQFQLMKIHGASTINACFARSFASRASKQTEQKKSETRKEVSTVEDPFDAPTYNIPEKPVTFTEGASYSIIILAGLGVAAAAAYAVFKELIFEPKEYKIFNKALKRIQDDAQVRVRIGSPITGYGQESRNRAARQRIPNKVYTDEDGVEHVLVNFYIRGPHGAGKVSAEMFKDKVDKQWKYTYLIVQIMQPSQSQLILESYMPAPVPVPS
ncbi:probable mitochondrial import inner membrane translocase subunit TIM21 isoform X2 [Hevea brasiliensis]|uniref:probable mitochondrial import inner membrane translocase subunit TIM21 isoform X2 n=1 Tax=Hevea brasiliensis TaxID=3981 RepID=UPI0025F8E03B|nr:probable mitochondrial import inner membrane translocase subunit TIM21 isoform X2 [Hevea brasiliensis]